MSVVIPDRASPIIAWRAWDLNGSPVVGVESAASSICWPVGAQLRAVCRKREDYEAPDEEWAQLVGEESWSHAPEEQCQCGIYALKSVRKTMNEWGGHHVLGEVALWGKVVEGEEGYRAEYGLPVSFYVTRVAWAVRQVLAAYGVPVLPRPLLKRTEAWAQDTWEPPTVISDETANSLQTVGGTDTTSFNIFSFHTSGNPAWPVSMWGKIKNLWVSR